MNSWDALRRSSSMASFSRPGLCPGVVDEDSQRHSASRPRDGVERRARALDCVLRRIRRDRGTRRTSPRRTQPRCRGRHRRKVALKGRGELGLVHFRNQLFDRAPRARRPHIPEVGQHAIYVYPLLQAAPRIRAKKRGRDSREGPRSICTPSPAAARRRLRSSRRCASAICWHSPFAKRSARARP